MATWHEPWTEIWATGHGRDRSYCGIAETEEGYAVDVFQGDTCVASTTFRTRQDAERAAHSMRGQYVHTPTVVPVLDLDLRNPTFAH